MQHSPSAHSGLAQQAALVSVLSPVALAVTAEKFAPVSLALAVFAFRTAMHVRRTRPAEPIASSSVCWRRPRRKKSRLSARRPGNLGRPIWRTAHLSYTHSAARTLERPCVRSPSARTKSGFQDLLCLQARFSTCTKTLLTTVTSALNGRPRPSPRDTNSGAISWASVAAAEPLCRAHCSGLASPRACRYDHGDAKWTPTAWSTDATASFG